MARVLTENLEALPPTVPLWPDASRILGMGRSTAYQLAKHNQFPVRVLRVGSRYRVSRADLLRYLGEAS